MKVLLLLFLLSGNVFASEEAWVFKLDSKKLITKNAKSYCMSFIVVRPFSENIHLMSLVPNMQSVEAVLGLEAGSPAARTHEIPLAQFNANQDSQFWKNHEPWTAGGQKLVTDDVVRVQAFKVSDPNGYLTTVLSSFDEFHFLETTTYRSHLDEEEGLLSLQIIRKRADYPSIESFECFYRPYELTLD